MPYLTPQAATGVILCRRLRFDSSFASIITGALNRLIYPSAWEVGPDGVSVDDTLALIRDTWEHYLNGGDTCMVGTIIAYATTAAPEGVLPCAGGTYLRVDYPDLYAALDAVFIVDADHFIVPDLRGRTVIGTGNGAGLTNRSVGETGGEETHSLTLPEIPAHTHSDHEHTPDVDVEGPAGVPQGAPGIWFPSSTGSAGGGGAHENMPPFTALKYGIIAR